MNTNRGSQLLGAVLGSAFALATGTAAMAGEDIYGGGLKGGYDVPPPPPSDRHIYLKGYVGQANPDVGSIWTSGFLTNNFTVHHEDIKSTPFWGFGLGYKRNHWLRFDGTLEYRGDALFIGHDSYPGGVGFTGGTNEYTADVSSWLGLVNAYWDIVNWCGFTPYVGAGIGFATVSVKGLKDVNVPQNSVFFADGRTSTNFSWAVYGGLAYEVTPQFVVDLTYRYTDLGSARSGVATAYDGSDSFSGVHVNNITSNDVMLGVRYKLQREQPVMYAVK